MVQPKTLGQNASERLNDFVTGGDVFEGGMSSMQRRDEVSRRQSANRRESNLLRRAVSKRRRAGDFEGAFNLIQQGKSHGINAHGIARFGEQANTAANQLNSEAILSNIAGRQATQGQASLLEGLDAAEAQSATVEAGAPPVGEYVPPGSAATADAEAKTNRGVVGSVNVPGAVDYDSPGYDDKRPIDAFGPVDAATLLDMRAKFGDNLTGAPRGAAVELGVKAPLHKKRTGPQAFYEDTPGF